MQSKAQFDLTDHKGPGLQPCVRLTIKNTDDLRDVVANEFKNSLGHTHRLLFWEKSYGKDENGFTGYTIKPYKPESIFALLDVTEISSKPFLREFRSKLLELCDHYGVTINTEITDGLLYSDYVPTLTN